MKESIYLKVKDRELEEILISLLVSEGWKVDYSCHPIGSPDEIETKLIKG